MIFRKKVFGSNNRKIVFILTGWKTKIWHFGFVANILKRNGFQSIVYEYDKKILSSNTKETVKYLNEVKLDVINTINILKKRGIKDFNLFGTSLGTMLSLMVSDEIKDIKKIILNLTGADLAEIVWSWDKVSDTMIKRNLIKQKINLNKLKQLWYDLAPINNLKMIGNQKLLIYLSETDEIIPYLQGTKLTNKLQQMNINFKLFTNNRSNHFFSGLINLLNYKKYLNFLLN
ncbi:MAG: prolyl oligopeptidase family serine peptidase [Patescibacteria group bacterium]|jgi:esterase/lipase